MWKRLVDSLTNLSTGISLWGQLFGAGGVLAGGAMSAWAASASDVLKAYGPIAYVAAALLGGLTVVTCLALYGIWRRALAEAALTRSRTEPPQTINPLLASYERRRINLDDFRHPVIFPKYNGTGFIECEIFGPAILVLQGSSIDKCRFVDCDHIFIDEKILIYNGILFSESHFIGCNFFKITFYVNIQDRPILEAAGVRALNASMLEASQARQGHGVV